MNRFTIVTVAVAFALGSVVTLYFTPSEPSNSNLMSGMDHDGGVGTSSPNMTMTMSNMTKELEGKSGNALDLAFIEGMIEHHKGAVAMAEMVVNETKRPELKVMAQNIIETQNEEIITMEGWLRQWYGR